MNYPCFLAIERSTPDDGAFPTALAWSLPDGSIKSILIVPDDDWEPWDNHSPDLDVQHLYEQGESPIDVIRELDQDVEQGEVYLINLDDSAALLYELYECFGQEPDFNLRSSTDSIEDIEKSTLLADYRDILDDNQLNPDDAFDQVKSWLYLFAQHAK